MSIPENILDTTENYICHCVIAAFPNTPEAEQTEIPLEKALDMGDNIPGSQGIVVVNDHRPSASQVLQFNIEYNWRSVEVISTLTAGEIMIADRNATGFIKFLKESVSDEFGLSLGNITFVLKVFWLFENSSGSSSPEIVDSKKFYFSVADIRHKTDTAHNVYMMNVLSLYNAKMQLPNLCNLYNMTLTHEDGNLHDEIPTPQQPGGGIRPRAEEDAAKLPPRQERIDKSKPMETLDDVFNALETELNESVEIHDMQLQKWQEIIREGFEEKLLTPAIQVKDLPIEYEVHLEDPYPSYKIDNRNLPFEQPEQAQFVKGIRTIPCKAGESFYKFIDNIIGMTKTAGIDAEQGFRPKVVAVWRNLGDTLKVDIRIRRVEIASKETGPGEGAIDPLTFFYRPNSGDPDIQNVDVYKIVGRTSKNVNIEVTEESPETEEGQVSFGGDRENITVEREPGFDFFQAGYSGHRAFIANNKVMGVEFPHEFAKYLSSGFTMQYLQDAEMKITIRGNPDLFSDVIRQPTSVADGSTDSPVYYARPEMFPMHVRFKIYYTDPNDTDTDFENENLTGLFYYEDLYMHLYKIQNSMSNGIFYQHLHLLREDELI